MKNHGVGCFVYEVKIMPNLYRSCKTWIVLDFVFFSIVTDYRFLPICDQGWVFQQSLLNALEFARKLVYFKVFKFRAPSRQTHVPLNVLNSLSVVFKWYGDVCFSFGDVDEELFSTVVQ